MNPVKLYGIPASNAVLTVQLALEHKGIDYKRVDLLPVFHRVGMPLRRFGGVTVPGIVIDGRRVHGSLASLRALDEQRTGPPLFPADPLRRREVENAVSWGEENYQPVARRLLPYSLLRRPRAVGSLLQDSRTLIPASVLSKTAAPALFANSRIHHSNEDHVRRMLGELPAMLDLVDSWMNRSLGGGQYHVAHPGGRAHETRPVNALEAEGRRRARFFRMGHTPGRVTASAPTISLDFPFTLDMRR